MFTQQGRDGKGRTTKRTVQTGSQTKKDAESQKGKSNVPQNISGPAIKDSVCDRKALIAAQKSDTSLDKVREFADQDPGESTSYFVVQDEVLYRVFVPEGKDKIFQIVVPQKFRNDVMKMAHDIPLAGYLGNRKTRNRIMQHFTGMEFSKMCLGTVNHVLLSERYCKREDS